MQSLTLKLIEFYQIFLSPKRGLLMVLVPGSACKYEISCSEYTKIKIKEAGVARGIGAGIRRIISCR